MSETPLETLLSLTRQWSAQLQWHRELGMAELPRDGAFAVTAEASPEDALAARPSDGAPQPASGSNPPALAAAVSALEAPAREAFEARPLDATAFSIAAPVADDAAAAAPAETPRAEALSDARAGVVAPVLTPAPEVAPSAPADPVEAPPTSHEAPVATVTAPQREGAREPSVIHLSPVMRSLFASVATPAVPAVPEAPLVGPARVAALTVLQNQVSGCTRCGLAEGRKNTVFSRGDSGARLMFVGEGPGESEDLQGVAFVGAAGQLLDRVITGMGLDPARDVYLANVVKCRLFSNRNPEPDEMRACGGFLEAQIATIGPEVIVCLGRVAANYLLKNSEEMGRMRGQWRAYRGIAVMPTWHPSYVLREKETPGSPARRELWEDMKLVLGKLGLAVPPPRQRA